MTDTTFNEPENDLLLAIERFKLVAKATHDVIWDWDLGRGTVWWNEGMQEIFGYRPEDIENGPNSWFDRIHPDDQEQVVKKIYKIIEKGENNWSDFYRFRRADGSYAHVHDRGYTIRSGDKPVRMVGSMMDISRQLYADKARQESEENLTFAIQAAQLGTWNLNPADQTALLNDRCKELYGYPTDADLSYGGLVQFIHPEDRARVIEAVENALNPSLRALYDVRYRVIGASDRKLRWLHCTGRAYFDSSGNAYRFAGISREITSEITSQEKIAWADQQAAMTIEGSGAGSFMVTLATNEIIYSPTMARIITGSEAANMTRDILLASLHPDDIGIRNQAYAEAEDNGELRYEARFIWNDGSVHWVRVLGRYLYDSMGKAVSLSGIVMDITDRIESEERYRQLASELERRVGQRTDELHQANIELVNSNNNLQQFAYAASHDMQEPLRKIQSFGSRLASTYSEKLDDNGKYMLNRIQDASKRMSAMIDDLLKYSRLTTREGEFHGVRLDEIVHSVLADLELSIQEQKTDIIVGDMPVVWGNDSQLTQLMQNLISNAVKYRLPDQESIIRLSYRPVDEAEKETLPKLLPNHRYIRLEVSDNGIGFDEIYLDRIFQMFQRLHGRSEFSGSGIGLALCKKVVQNHHGYITARSRPGEGATFIVYLPQPR